MNERTNAQLACRAVGFNCQENAEQIPFLFIYLFKHQYLEIRLKVYSCKRRGTFLLQAEISLKNSKDSSKES